MSSAEPVVSRFLLEILACPRCEDRPLLALETVGDDHFLVCTGCQARYPIVQGIPRLLPEDAVLPEESQL